MRPLGTQQREILAYMAGTGRRPGYPSEAVRDRHYPGDGWIWDTESHTLTLLKSLENRGFVKFDGRVYRVTEAGKAFVIKGYTVDEEKAAREDREHLLLLARRMLRKNAEAIASLATKIQTGQVSDDNLYLSVKTLTRLTKDLSAEAEAIANDYR